jgi:hypothetical protein
MKKPAKSVAHRKFSDLHPRKNAKGGSTILNLDPSLSIGLAGTTGTGGTGGGGKQPVITEISITKKTDSSSPNLFNSALGG